MMEKRVKASKLLFFIFLLCLLFILLQFTAPFMQDQNSFFDLSGSTMIIDNDNYWKELHHPWQDIYRIGDFLCHTKATRSFYLNQNQLPFCARCTAIWLGLSVGIGLMVFFSIKNYSLFFIGFIGSVGLLGIDGVGQLLGLWESTNLIRFITGIIVGIFTGIAIGLIFEEIQKYEKIKKIENKVMLWCGRKR